LNQKTSLFNQSLFLFGNLAFRNCNKKRVV